MNFYVDEYMGKKNGSKKRPYVLLVTDNWDDWSVAETLFHAKYKSKDGKVIELGKVKIMTTQSSITRDVIDRKFKALDSTYCSLGQSLDYYQKISELDLQEQEAILKGLRDVAINDEIANKFRYDRIFESSLLRFSEAVKAFKEAKKIIRHEQINKLLKFSFIYKLEGATKEHRVDLDFSEEDHLPHRINAFIGKNATGKTRILTELSSRLSGVAQNRGNFIPERPSFSKIITISYSAFDELYKPFEKKGETELKSDKIKNDRQEENVFFSYVYCGLRDRNGILSIKDIEDNFFDAYEKVIEENKEKEWLDIMQNVLEDEHIELIEKISESRLWGDEVEESLSSVLSSGQNILLSTMTEVIAHIDKDSLLLFDEPEIHLHPNAIANFMRMFYKILKSFDSYAIISTHSPIILQEIPSKYVRVFSRIENTPSVDFLYSECFGENISNITNDVFEVREHESNYKTWFRKMVDKGFDKETILDLFENDLSYNALTYLNSLYYHKEKEGS